MFATKVSQRHRTSPRRPQRRSISRLTPASDAPSRPQIRHWSALRRAPAGKTGSDLQGFREPSQFPNLITKILSIEIWVELSSGETEKKSQISAKAQHLKTGR